MKWNKIETSQMEIVEQKKGEKHVKREIAFIQWHRAMI